MRSTITQFPIDLSPFLHYILHYRWENQHLRAQKSGLLVSLGRHCWRLVDLITRLWKAKYANEKIESRTNINGTAHIASCYTDAVCLMSVPLTGNEFVCLYFTITQLQDGGKLEISWLRHGIFVGDLSEYKRWQLKITTVLLW